MTICTQFLNNVETIKTKCMINYIIQICSANMFMGQTEDCQVEETSSNMATSTSGKDCGRNQMLLN